MFKVYNCINIFYVPPTPWISYNTGYIFPCWTILFWIDFPCLDYFTALSSLGFIRNRTFQLRSAGMYLIFFPKISGQVMKLGGKLFERLNNYLFLECNRKNNVDSSDFSFHSLYDTGFAYGIACQSSWVTYWHRDWSLEIMGFENCL